jgi:hypothetical protein
MVTVKYLSRWGGHCEVFCQGGHHVKNSAEVVVVKYSVEVVTVKNFPEMVIVKYSVEVVVEMVIVKYSVEVATLRRSGHLEVFCRDGH